MFIAVGCGGVLVGRVCLYFWHVLEIGGACWGYCGGLGEAGGQGGEQVGGYFEVGGIDCEDDVGDHTTYIQSHH